MERVTMTHPDLPGQSAVVSRKAFEEVWAVQGWQAATVQVQVEQLEPEPEQQPPTGRKSKSKEAPSG